MCRKKTLAKIAYQYYIDGRSQNEIAREINVNRATISRMLKEARDSNVVTIEIDYYDEKLLELESFLKNHFELKNVIIASTSRSPYDDESLYEEAAEYIQRIIKNGDNVGISWGKTISKVVTKTGYKQAKHVTFIPLAGGSSPTNIKYHVNSMVHEMAGKFSGRCLYVNTRVIQEKKGIKRS